MNNIINGHQEVKIAIFAKNEDATLETVVNEALEVYPGEKLALVVDEITECVKSIGASKGVRIIKDNGRGKGNAIRTAIELIPCDILVLMDSDGSHRPKDIPLLVEPLLKGEADMVIASRLKGGSEEFSGSLINYVHLAGNYLASSLIRVFWGKGGGLMDCLNGFRAIRLNAAKRLGLREDEFAIEEEMVISCYKNDFRIMEVPSYEFKRRHGVSRINRWSNLAQCARCIFRNLIG